MASVETSPQLKSSFWLMSGTGSIFRGSRSTGPWLVKPARNRTPAAAATRRAIFMTVAPWVPILSWWCSAILRGVQPRVGRPHHRRAPQHVAHRLAAAAADGEAHFAARLTPQRRDD